MEGRKRARILFGTDKKARWGAFHHIRKSSSKPNPPVSIHFDKPSQQKKKTISNHAIQPLHHQPLRPSSQQQHCCCLLLHQLLRTSSPFFYFFISPFHNSNHPLAPRLLGRSFSSQESPESLSPPDQGIKANSVLVFIADLPKVLRRW